jgi:uncharacterized membrane protein (DUF4010 family)
VIVSVINVDFRSRTKIPDNAISYNDLISLIEELIDQDNVTLAISTLAEQLKISPSSANILLIAIMLDHKANSVKST